MRFCIELYGLQIQGGRYFIHEHPDGATSWQMPETVKLLTQRNVGIVLFDMCQFGMAAERQRAKLAIQRLVLKPGDMVRCHRDSQGKDAFGWYRPALIVSTDHSDEGIVDVRLQFRVIPCQFRDVHQTIAYLTPLASPRRGD